MKTTSKQLTLKSLAMFVGVMGITLLLFSCAKGGADNNANPNNNTNANCVNCTGIVNGQNFFQSQSVDISNQFSLSLNFAGSGTTAYPTTQYSGQTGYPTTGYSMITSYNGLVYAQGQLQIPQGINSYNCSIPAGTYTVQTVQAAQWSYPTISVLVMQATGPVSLMVQLSNAYVEPPGGGRTWAEVPPIGRIWGNVIIQSLNGYNCQTSTLIQ